VSESVSHAVNQSVDRSIDQSINQKRITKKKHNYLQGAIFCTRFGKSELARLVAF